MFTKVRFAVSGLLVAASLALAPAAFARSHWNVGVNIGLPGIGIGFSDYGHHGRGWGGNYYGGGYYGYSGGYYGGYAPAPVYYSPAYYAPAYYAPAYYGGSVYYSDHRGRGYYDGHDRHYRRDDRRGDYGHRASYYDRSGYRH